jgi:GxxExxY protein
MHKNYSKAHKWSEAVIGAAIEVHRLKGPGLLEDIYEKCLLREFEIRNIPASNQVMVPLEYKGKVLDQSLRLDLVIDDCMIIELKAVEQLLPIHKAQLLTYMKLMDAPLGLLINFHSVTLKSGLCRLILHGADAPDVDF